METHSASPAAIRQVIREYIAMVKKYKKYFYPGLLLPGIGSIFVFYVPPVIVGAMIDRFVSSGTISIGVAMTYLFAFAGLWAVGEVFWRAGMHFVMLGEGRAIEELANKTYQRLLERDYTFYANNFVGSLTKKALAYSREFELFMDTLVFSVTSNAIPLIFVSVILWNYSPLLPLLLLTWLGIAIGISIPLVRRRSKLVIARHATSSRLAGRLADSITNMPAIKAFGTERQESKTYAGFTSQFIGRWTDAARFQNLRYLAIMSPIYVLTNVTGLLLVIFLAQRYQLDPGSIVVSFSFYARFSMVFWEISRVYRQLESAINEAAEFTQLVLEPPRITDMPRAKKLRVSSASIEFKGAGFKYPDTHESQDLFLKDFNLTIPHGQKVGLVGPSGGGKSTITKLLLRFVDLNEGEILIDGQNIAKTSQESLHHSISFVPQESQLFHRTLQENIAYAKPDATEKEILRASKQAHAHEFIQKLPEGYDTLVGERGIKLSGGQRQRVALARAILKDAPILVLDEATSALDSESEVLIQKALVQLMKKRTAIVIAHRLSTIQRMDRIIVLTDGAIVEDGTHQELLDQGGLYAELWKHQSGGFLED